MSVPALRFPEFEGEWEPSKLKNITRIYDGTHQTPNYVAEGVPFYSVEHVTANQFERTKFISEEVYEKENKRVKLERNDILMTRIGDIGTARLVDWDVRASFYVSLALLKSNPSEFESGFLSSYLGSDYLSRELHRRTIHVAFPKKINLGEIGETELSLPSVSEQKKIAAFLGVVDAKIAALRERRAGLERYKRGLMQALFSQTLRFTRSDGSAFSDWEVTTIGQIGAFYYGKSAPKFSLADDAPTPCVRYGELYSHYGLVIGEIKSRTHIAPKNLKFSKGMEILVPRVGEDPLDFSTCCLLPHAGVAIGEMISVFETTQNQLFYTYYFRTLKFEFAKMVEGGSVSNLYFRYLEPIKIGKPHPDEQAKIADALSAMDAKIAAVGDQVARMEAFKKGLLQQMFV